MKYRHIIWDWNGTLLSDVAEVVATVDDLLARRLLPPLTVERYMEIFDFPVIDFYRRLGFTFQTETYEAMAQDYIDTYLTFLPRCRLQPGALENLQVFQHAGLTQSVLSAYHQNRLEEAIKLFGLEAYFIRWVGLNDYCAHSKVDSGKRWLAQLPHDSREVLLIGDTSHDVEVAGQMGIDCVLLTCGHQPARRLAGCGVPLFASLADIRQFVLSGV